VKEYRPSSSTTVWTLWDEGVAMVTDPDARMATTVSGRAVPSVGMTARTRAPVPLMVTWRLEEIPVGRNDQTVALRDSGLHGEAVHKDGPEGARGNPGPESDMETVSVFEPNSGQRTRNSAVPKNRVPGLVPSGHWPNTCTDQLLGTESCRP
jgi:hypothetical protein